MDLLKGRIRPLYFKYLSAAFGSALISSIYGIVDMAMVGQYQGPQGTAAMAVISPIWNIIYSLGLLMGIGGSVLLSTLRGKSEDNLEKSNEYFTASVIGVSILALLIWIALIFFDRELLLLFGAEESLMPLARRYVLPVKFGVPLFLFSQLLSAFLRNDANPGLATRAVLCGGVFNVFGDYILVFVLDLGILGAGMATCLGCLLTVCVMLMHFLKPQCTLRFVRPARLLHKLGRIILTGFSTFFIDVAMGILTVLFNRQILRYLGTNALSVYGIIINISTFVQCCAYSIGQASQPILSVNFGAKRFDRIRETLKCALGTAAFGLIWTALCVLAPNLFIRIFMQPTQEILAIAPAIIRSYGVSFLLLPLNIFSTYYFQALLKPRTSFIVSVGRGAVISGVLICLLPLVAGSDSIWFAMPITELITAVYVASMMLRYTKTTERVELT
ncbi:MAG: MATE family efflux transporter [Eubacteriales bacterium]|nr:MATE family efflux transporter [Eubacteriales bacterium]